ncbi:hypothetical protein [Jiangella anatolica]|uniref:AMP-dependent synthetase/ligase domain-containing protein n=1 Tax=Jiangella anatolica TaxID=2670374 RepID=A0A2W2B7V6_9ACTN|nr:hypothetical protein [Jiangella anatolica]PZF83355.1 hypothetical protein C1I92_13010 [Jiangella anatolica]
MSGPRIGLRRQARGLWTEVPRAELVAEAQASGERMAAALSLRPGEDVLAAESPDWPGTAVVLAACLAAGAVANVPESPATAAAAARQLAPQVLVAAPSTWDAAVHSARAEIDLARGVGGWALRQATTATRSGPLGRLAGALARNRVRRRFGWQVARAAGSLGGPPEPATVEWLALFGLAVVTLDEEAER